MKKKIFVIAYIVIVVLFTICIKKLPFWLLNLYGMTGLHPWGIEVFVVIASIIGAAFAIILICGYKILKPFMASSIEHKRFWGVFFLCVVLSVSIINFIRVDAFNFYYKTTPMIEVYTDLEDDPIIVPREIIAGSGYVDGDSRYGDYIVINAGSKLHQKLNLADDIYINVKFLTHYSYTIG